MDIQHHLIVLNGNIDGSPARLVNARQLHAFLGVRRDFSNWVKGRIATYEFEVGVDFVVLHNRERFKHSGNGGDRRSVEYHLSLEMAKHLSTVERTPLGRQALHYLNDVEHHQEQPIQQQTISHLSRQERKEINRQAWADVSDQVAAAFHARREELLRNYVQRKAAEPTCIPTDFRPSWAR